MDKFFPIKTATACQLKWNWSTIRMYNGTTSSCHRVNGDILTVDNFNNFHNTPKKLSDRALMLTGEWPAGGCEYCQNIEAAGGHSDRMFHSSIPNMSPPELNNDITATTVTPRIVEIYFDNVCNMSCIYCWDGFSSKIQQENIKFGRFSQDGVIIDNRAIKTNNIVGLTEKFWEWMEQFSSEILRFHVLGGEPFYQRQFDQCLDFLSTHYNPNLEFNVISNLKVPLPKLRNIINRIQQLVLEKRIKRFDLTASIDCFGPEQEYVRFGINLNEWRENFEFLVSQDWITVNINQTLSGLTIKTIPALLEYINRLRLQRIIGHYFSTTVMPAAKYLHPSIFGAGYFNQDFKKILALMPIDTWQQKEANKYMHGIQLQLNLANKDQAAINQLVIYLTELDRRRNTSWKEVFPWLIKEVINVV